MKSADLPPMSHPLVSIDAVDLAFPLRHGGRLRVLNRVSLQVAPGEFIAVLGPSGCGKSSLLRIAAGLIAPSSGQCVFGLHRPDPLWIGMNFQRPVLLPWLTVRENALLPFQIAGVEVPAAALQRLERLLQVAGLQGFEHALPAELSGGMQMRASLIRTFVPAPQLVLMDEPFGALDEVTRLRLGVELRRMAADSGCSIVFVTHNIQEAVFLADRVVLLSARPAHIVDQFLVALGAQRQEALYDDPQFASLCRRIRSRIDSV